MLLHAPRVSYFNMGESKLDGDMFSGFCVQGAQLFITQLILATVIVGTPLKYFFSVPTYLQLWVI